MKKANLKYQQMMETIRNIGVLQRTWEKACNSYATLFLEKHGSDEPVMWVGDMVGVLLYWGDTIVAMGDIMTDIDRDVDKAEYEKWRHYDHIVVETHALPAMNYNTWVSLCPRASDETIHYIEDMAKVYRGDMRHYPTLYANIKEMLIKDGVPPSQL